MRIQRMWKVAAMALFLSGCATLQDVSSGQTGCTPEEIAISNDKVGWATRTWTATCRGQAYMCSAHQGGNNSTAQVSCTPRQEAVAAKSVAPAAAPAPSTAGCTYDTQCKGDRICVKSECVDPTPASGTPQPAATASEPAAAAQPH